MASVKRYVPDEPIETPGLFRWPPNLPATLKYLTVGLLFPWGYLFIALAVFSWFFLTPDFAKMATLAPGWIMLIWLRNAALLSLVAGGLHWWLYVRRSQARQFKFDNRWPAQDSKAFVFKNQVKDNMFWSLASGVTIWTTFECVTLWLYASGQVAMRSWSEAPALLTALCVGTFFWSTFHFYFVHRFLHWEPMYRFAHELHHRNVNTGPWSGISMHPVEHLLYFSLSVLWWFVPVHPVIIILTGFYNGISPAVSHSGFDWVKIGNWKISAGDHFHNLHHRLFEVNYGNTSSPLDKLFGTWHDGSSAAHEALRHRRRSR